MLRILVGSYVATSTQEERQKFEARKGVVERFPYWRESKISSDKDEDGCGEHEVER